MNFKHVIALLITFSPVAANAACPLSNKELAGTWSAYSSSTNIQFGGYGYGKLTFKIAGAFDTSPAASFLELKNGTKITFKGGSLKLATNCSIIGDLITTDDITLSVTNGRLNGSKNVILGVYNRTDGDYGIINLIR